MTHQKSIFENWKTSIVIRIKDSENLDELLEILEDEYSCIDNYRKDNSHKVWNMKLNNEELNIILDGLTDTKIRIKEKEIPSDFDYKTKLFALTKRVERKNHTHQEGDVSI